MNDAAKELVTNVIGELSEEGFFSIDRFINTSVEEVNQALQEQGVLGVQRRFALCKFREDFTGNLNNALNEKGKSELVKLSPLKRFQLVAPPYLHQLLDEEHSQNLIEVWIEQMITGAAKIPDKLPVLLYDIVKKDNPEWAKFYMVKENPQLNVITNRELLQTVFVRVGLL